MSQSAAVKQLSIRLLLEYDGTRYLGWQSQNEGPSVEACLVDAIEKLTQQRVPLTVAGRTDAGVHAVGQVVSFTIETAIEARRLRPGLNHYLPDDISIHRAEVVPNTFNAKRDSTAKRYRYRVYRSPAPAALENRDAWHIRKPLALKAMREAAALLIGELDFNAFRSAQCDAPHARRTMFAIDITQHPRPPMGEHVEIIFRANAFCRHMCRILAGTLVEVGMGQRSVQQVADALQSRDRRRAGRTAPAHGLTLLQVEYPHPGPLDP